MDMRSESGGKIPMAISICEHLKKIDKFEFCYITTFKETQKILEIKHNTKEIGFDLEDICKEFNLSIKSF